MLAGAAVGSMISCDFSASSPTPPHIQDTPAPVGRNFQRQQDLTGKLSAGEGKSVAFSASGEAIVSGPRQRTVKIGNAGGGRGLCFWRQGRAGRLWAEVKRGSRPCHYLSRNGHQRFSPCPLGAIQPGWVEKILVAPQPV